MPLKKFKPKRHETRKFNLNKREDSQARGYDSEWSKFTFRFKHYNKNCYACGSNQKINVDHILTKRYYPELAEDKSNFMPLCQSCHSTVTNKFERHNPPDIKGKLEWINRKRADTNTTIRIKVIEYRKK